MKQSTAFFAGTLFIISTLLSSCQMDDSSQMSESKQRQMQSTFESMQKSHKMLLQEFEKDSASMPEEMKVLYSQLHKMHQQMSKNHKHMMSGHKKKAMNMQHENKQIKKRHRMRRQMQNSISQEWYKQMQSMHNQMAQRHDQLDQSNTAKKHRNMSQGYGRMKNMVPQSSQLTDGPVNENADPALLNGSSLYAKNCASCHGSNAKGIGNAFPPLVNSKWVTGEKSIVIRIIRDGLHGKIQVNNETYNGIMPSFKARLSMAEIASITNYLRDESDGDHPHITQDEVIEISKTYQSRNEPWQPNELLGE